MSTLSKFCIEKSKVQIQSLQTERKKVLSEKFYNRCVMLNLVQYNSKLIPLN
jgi:hypothetical protein